MAEVVVQSGDRDEPEERVSRIGRLIDVLSDSTAVVSVIALFGMKKIVCYEVISSSVFNEPNTWVTEISTYVFVAIVFLVLAPAQKANSHIQVEVLISQLSPEWRARLEL